MIVYDDLYVSESLVKDKKNIIRNLRHAKMFRPDIFIVYLNDNTDKPEVMQGFFFNQIYYQVGRTVILGITKSREEAVNYMAELMAGRFGASITQEDD